MDDRVFVGIDTEKEWVQRWEDREVEFRKIVADARKDYDKYMKSMNQKVSVLSADLSKKQVMLKSIEEIPLVGKYLIYWAERKWRNGYINSFNG